jgi:hypothetical protein
MTIPVVAAAAGISALHGAAWWGLAGGVAAFILNAATDGPTKAPLSWAKTGALVGAGLGVGQVVLAYAAFKAGSGFGDAELQYESLWEGRPWLAGLVGVAVGGYLINAAIDRAPLVGPHS